MKQEEFIKALTYLGLAYGKEYNSMESQQIYDFLCEYNYETFTKAVKNIIRTSKFAPKISDLIEECEKCKSSVRFEVIEYMKECGYFYLSYRPEHKLDEAQAMRNYLKVKTFVERGIIPDWLQEDMNQYYQKMNKIRLENKSQQLLS